MSVDFLRAAWIGTAVVAMGPSKTLLSTLISSSGVAGVIGSAAHFAASVLKCACRLCTQEEANLWIWD